MIFRAHRRSLLRTSAAPLCSFRLQRERVFMALHRDIYWIGRQWAVTGFGVQAVDQRLKGAFDIEIARLWEDDLPRRMRSLAWLNVDDFNKALEMARARHPEPPRRTLSLVESVLELIQPMPAASEPPKPVISVSKPAAALREIRPAVSRLETSTPLARPAPIELPAAKIPLMAWRVERASAKFLPQWRIRH
jgi:hypothetical protein